MEKKFDKLTEEEKARIERQKILQKCKEIDEMFDKSLFITEDEIRIAELTKDVIKHRQEREKELEKMSKEDGIIALKEQTKRVNSAAQKRKQKTIMIEPKKNGNGEV